MQTLLTYQLCENEHFTPTAVARLRALLKSNGYQDFITGINTKGEKTKSALPDTTLYKERISPKDARAELRAAARTFHLRIECCIAVEIIGWSGISLKKG